MNKHEIRESGVIDINGQLRLPMDRLNAFFAANKGKRVVVSFEAAEHGSTAAQHAYYYKYVLPTIVDAYRTQGTRMSTHEVDKQLLWLYPGDFLTIDHIVPTRAEQLDVTQMTEFLDWLKQFAAENLNVYIEDPRSI